MKKRLVTFLSAAAVSAAFIFSGCGGNAQYKIYTNIPNSQFKKHSSNYSTEKIIEGFEGEKANGMPAQNPSSLKTKGKSWFGIIGTDITATLNITDDFADDEVSARFNSLCNDIDGVMYDLNYSLSSTVEESCMYAFNQAEAGATVEITKTAFNVLDLAKSVYDLTEGYYNPAVYYNVQAYGFGTAYDYPQTAAELPKDEDIEKYNQLAAHFKDVELKEQDGKYFAVKPETTVEVNGKTRSMKIDLGGIGKGYAADAVSALVDGYGFQYGNFTFGGSSNFYKNNYMAGNYVLRVNDPRNVFDYYVEIPVANQCISTSGDNVQCYFIDGVRYSHVIDPTTGKPVQTGIMSATVIGGSAAEDDALTTALMAMGKDKAVEFIKTKLTDRRVIFTYDSSKK